MTASIRTLLLCVFVLCPICSLFITIGTAHDTLALMLASLAHQYRALRRRQSLVRLRFARSAFHRFACVAMILVISMQLVLTSPQVSHAAFEAASSTAINYGQDAHFWWHSSGWATRYERLRNEFLPRIGVQAQPRGWDGKGAPRSSSPDPQIAEMQQDRDQRIAKIKIFPGDVEIKTGEQIIFNAIAFDYEDNPVGGVDVKWSALRQGSNQPITITRPGTFISGVAGRFIVAAEIAGRRDEVKIRVTGESRRANLKSRSETHKSSADSRRLGILRAPISHDQNRIASKPARKSVLRRSEQTGIPAPPDLRAASAPMSTRPVLSAMAADETGWNSGNNDTMDDVGSERGHVPGRVVDGGVGSGNFQFAASAVGLDGRGMDLNLFLNYNSRVWHKAGSEMTFDIDRDWIPGWSLGFGKIVMAGDSYFLIDSDGTRHPYRGNLFDSFPAPASSLQSFEGYTSDGTFINYYAEGYKPEFDNSGGRNMIKAWAVMPNGTRIEYGAQANYAMYPTRITDANGNFITITYRNNEGPQIQTITDTLGRLIQFYYDGSGLLTSIVVPKLGGGGRVALRVQYQSLTLSNAGVNYGFAGSLTTKVRQSTIPVIKAIYYPGTSTGYWFGDGDSYSPYGMIRKVSERRGMTFDDNTPLDQQGNIGAGVMSREMVYNYPQSGGSYSDTPTYTQMTEDWVGRATDAAPVTHFLIVDSIVTGGERRTTTITRPDGVQIVQTAIISDFLIPPIPGRIGISDNTEIYRDGSLLSRVKKTFDNDGLVGYGSPRLTQTEITDELGRVRFILYSYDSTSRYNAVTDVRILGYGGWGGELLQRTHYEYLNDGNNGNYNGSLQNSGTLWWKGPGILSGGPTWQGSHIFNMVSMVEVYAGDNVTRLSRTEYQYDGISLIDNPGIVQHNIAYNPHTPDLEVCEEVPDPNDVDCTGCPPPPMECPIDDGICTYNTVCNYYPRYDPKTWYRGNVTQVKQYADAVSLNQGTAVVETRTFDIAGNVRLQSTSCCEQTSFNYTANTQYAWPESLTSGSPSDATKQNTGGATYDFNTGLVLTSTDANGRVSQTVYDSNTLRPVYEYSPTGAYQYHLYDDQNLFVYDFVYEAGQSGGNVASRSDKYLDGLGRVIRETAAGKDYVWDAVETKFDNLGRVWQQSRPYRQGVETPQWSMATYDSLDRLIQTDSPDGSTVTRDYNPPNPAGSSGQPGQTAKVTDPWGRERWARSDVLGRIVEVAEPDPGGAGSLSSGAMYTTYTYDALDRLTQVNQGAQTRRFRYDSLGRLTHQKLAERDATLNDSGQWTGGGQWSDVFFYDTRSNLIRRVEARGVQTHYDFNDPLNRLLAVDYDKSAVPVHLSGAIPDAPDVSYGYVTSGDKNRVETITVANGMGSEQLSYDSEGRLAQVRQTFTGRIDYPLYTNYIWDSLDRLKKSTHPQQYGVEGIRNMVEPAYDIASRIDSLKFGIGGEDSETYASNPDYNAASQTTSLTVGNGIVETYRYDLKTGLMTSQDVKRSADVLVDLKYNYTLNNDQNNNGAKTGQLTGITDLKNTARNRAYEYDKLGRLSKVKGGVNTFNNPAWHQMYSFDRYGNRTLVSHTDLSMAPVLPGSQSRTDLIGKTAPGSAGGANRTFSADDYFAASDFNKGHGLTTTGFSDNDNAGTRMRGGPRVTEKEHGNAPIANGLGGKLRVEPPAGPTPPQGGTYSIWPLSTTPTVPMEDGGNAIEIGMKFRSDVNGYISGIRFYKGGPENAGAHFGHLWTSAGTLLGTVIFTNETSSGWQQAFFQAPIPITANTTYVVSYYAPQGNYLGEDGFFASSGVNNAPLHALQDGVQGGNGVYRYGSIGGFPTDTHASENYWVDVVVTTTPPTDTTPPAVNSFTPGSGATDVSPQANVTVTFSEMIDAATVNGSTIELRDPWNALVSATINYNAASLTATLDPTEALLSGATYTARVKGGGADPRIKDVAGNALASDMTWTFTTTPPAGCPCSIWGSGVTPTGSMEDPGNAVELGMKFRSESNGYISGIRFYKGGPQVGSSHEGRLWTGSGTLLGTVTFTNETSSGWQQALFSTPIPITANTTYVVSYFAPQGNYLGEDNFFASSGVDNAPLHALQDGVQGGNGVYLYTPTSAFPTDTFASENYWADVVFIYSLPDTTPPTVTLFTPAAEATNVSTGANVTVTFSEAMNAATVNGATVELRDPSNALVSATVSYDAGSLAATLDPTAALAPGVTYTARVRGGGTDPRVKDAAGNALAADATWNFTTAPQCIATVPGDHWKGEYFNNQNLSGDPVMVRDDGTGALNFNWVEGSPSSACGVPADNFSARWTRTATFGSSGTYRFTVTGDDGVRLYVDGQLKIDAWVLQSPTTYTVDVALTAGVHEIKLEYYENLVTAVAALSWQIIQSGLIPLDGLANLSYNAENNRITTSGFEYDPAGNQTRAVINASGTQQQYRYDSANRLVQVLDAGGNVLASYAYGASNQRLMSVEGSVTKYFAWAGGRIVAEYEALVPNALVWKMSYVYLGGRLLATTSGINGAEKRFHHPDRLGTRLVTDAGGTVVSEQLSMPFGTMLPFTSSYGGESSYQNQGLSNPSKKRFTSYDRSEATGLDYAVNRHYSSAQGRFTQVDPIGMSAVELANPQSLNLYAYVENDPINSSDPLGLDSTMVFRPYPVPPGGGGGGLSIGSFTFSFSFSGGGSINLGALQQSKKKQQTGGGIKRDVKPDMIIFVGGEPPDIGVETSNSHVFGRRPLTPEERAAKLDEIQEAFDTFGLIPGYGAFFNVVSALISLKKGDYVALGLSLASIIPFAGLIARGGKIGRRAIRIGQKWRARAITDAACRTGCENVAKQIQKHIGGEIKRIVPSDPAAGYLGAYRGHNLGWNYHEVVVKDGVVYDAFTGYQGMPINAYKKLWEFADSIKFGF